MCGSPNALSLANPVNDDDRQARTDFPIRVGSGADRDRRQAGPNERVLLEYLPLGVEVARELYTRLAAL